MKNKKIFKTIIPLLMISFISVPILVSCSNSSQTTDDVSNKYQTLKNKLQSNIKFNWDSTSLNYLQGNNSFEMKIIDSNKIIEDNQNYLKIEWYKNENLIVNNQNKLNLIINETGAYSCKFIFVDNNNSEYNNMVLFQSETLHFNIIDNPFKNVILQSTSPILTDQITNCTISLNNMPNNISTNQYKIEWYKNDLLMKAEENKNEIQISQKGTYLVKIINTQNNHILFLDSITIKYSISSTTLNPSLINWQNINLMFTSSRNEFDFSNKRITLSINNMPEQYWSESDRYDIYLTKNNLDITIFDVNKTSKTINTVLQYIDENTAGEYSFRIYDKTYQKKLFIQLNHTYSNW